ncbi:hypothetical protein BAU16_00600 [Enterococcus sp. JM9B]|nr:hypothetical protein BAU16_00600 [Enterococcus sp. JM9B]
MASEGRRMKRKSPLIYYGRNLRKVLLYLLKLGCLDKFATIKFFYFFTNGRVLKQKNQGYLLIP